MADERIPIVAAEGFEQGADAYEASRPSHRADALACIVGRAGIGPGRPVLDLAAGTGKLPRLLVPTGAEVVGRTAFAFPYTTRVHWARQR